MAEHIPGKNDGWQRYDWNVIEFEYVTSPEHRGLRQLAKKYGCNIKTIARHSKKDHWFQKRSEFLCQVRREAAIKHLMKRAEPDVLDVLNEERSALGLEPVDELPSEHRKMLREVVERMY